MAALTLEDWARLGPSLLSALFMVGFAAALLWLDFNRTAHRVFALFLVFRAGASTLALVRSLDILPAAVAQGLFGYFLLPVVPLLAYLACIYPRRRTWLGTSRWGGWLTLATVLAVEALYAWDHSLLWTYEPGHDLGAYSAAGGGLQYVAYGPLQIVTSLLYPSYAVLAVVLAWEYVSSARPTHSLFLVLCGFLLNALFDGTSRIVELVGLLGQSEPYPWMPWGWVRAVVPALTIVPCLAALGLLFANRRHAEPEVARRARRLLWLSPLPTASALAATFLASDASLAVSVPSQIVLGLWRLLLPALVTYALLRYQLFDLDVKVRLAVTDATLVAAFLVLFFALDQTLQLLLSQVSIFVALAESATMALLASRLHRMAARLSARLMPQAKRTREMTQAERLRAYRERYDMALEDGSLTPKEAAMLQALAARLGVPATDVPGVR